MYVLQIHNINVHCTLLSCIPLTWLKSVLNDNRSCKHVPCVKIMAFLFLIFLVNRYFNLDDHINNDQYTEKKRKQPFQNDLMILFLWSLIYILVQYRDKHTVIKVTNLEFIACNDNAWNETKAGKCYSETDTEIHVYKSTPIPCGQSWMQCPEKLKFMKIMTYFIYYMYTCMCTCTSSNLTQECPD